MEVFVPWTPAHFRWLAISALFVGLPLLVARCGSPRLAQWIVGPRPVGSASGAIILVTERGTTEWVHVLPLHLCDLVLVVALVAFLSRHPLAFELAYCFGIAGSTQAVLTPDIAGQLPLWRIAYFFGAHAAVIAAVLYLAVVERLRPRPGTVRRVMAVLALYAVAIGSFNALAGTNYGYLCHKPQQPSLLDYLGPWPWYILAVGLIAALCCWLLVLPFRRHQTHHSCPTAVVVTGAHPYRRHRRHSC